MTPNELLNALRKAGGVGEVEIALDEFNRTQPIRWIPFGRENNRGTIEVSSDPTRSCIERITNSADGVLELEHERHNGLPDCRTPKEAAQAWLDIPEGGLSGMTPAERRKLAQRITVTLEPGEGKESRVLTIRDKGIGIAPENMRLTILSLNESNKISKHYLVGAYGQGGSSTFAFSKWSLISSRYSDFRIGFTVVKFLDLPADQFKVGHYVYMVINGNSIPEADIDINEFPHGTEVRHFGYDLNNFGSPLGPNSLYGSMNTNLFDPVMPVWFDNRVHNYRRVIKGSRNALCGAVDDGDEHAGPTLSHSIPPFSVSLGDFGRIGIEYWVLLQPTRENKRPNAAFVNPTKPIVLTLNGQNQGEFSQLLIRKEAELPFLAPRMIAHVDCNNLSPTAKRHLFVSNREAQRDVKVREMIQQELVKAFRSDDIIKRLNDEARQHGMRQQDENAIQYMRKEVARLLRLQGLDLGSNVGGDTTTAGGDQTQPVTKVIHHPTPQRIELHDPPTFIRFVGDDDREFTFYCGQRRYIRIETDANSNYHDPNDPHRSNINLIVGDGLDLRGSTALKDGRMRAILECLTTSQVGQTGRIRVELKRAGLPVLIDERMYVIIAAPDARETGRKVSTPQFEAVPVSGPEDQVWTQLGWPENVNVIASQAQMEDGKLVVYYSTVFPKYARQLSSFESRSLDIGVSFTKRYEIWLVVHSFLKYQDDQTALSSSSGNQSGDGESARQQEESDTEDKKEREERCRMAIMSTMFAAREVQLDVPNISVAEE